MKVLCMFLIVACLAGCSAMGVDSSTQKRKGPKTVGRVTEGFQVSAAAESELVQSGMPARLRIKIKNVTDQALHLAEVGAEKDYKVRIWTDKGRTIPLTEHGRVLLNTEGSLYMNLSVIILPGQEREDILEISNIYDMKTPGNYWVVATRKVGGLHSKGVTQAESNPVHIKVNR